MGWVVLALVIAAMLIVPFVGADSRDGRDWSPGWPVHGPLTTRRGLRRWTRRTG